MKRATEETVQSCGGKLLKKHAGPMLNKKMGLHPASTVNLGRVAGYDT